MNPYPRDTPTVRDAAQPEYVTDELACGRIVVHDGATCETGRWMEGNPVTVRQ